MGLDHRPWWWLPLLGKGSGRDAIGTALVIIGGYLSFVWVFLYCYRIGLILNYRKATFPRVRRARKVIERPSPREFPVSGPIPTYFLLGLLGLVKKKKGASFLPSHLYAVCNFDISLPLPIKLNLPMVCQPLDWTTSYLKVKLSRLAIGKVLSEPRG